MALYYNGREITEDEAAIIAARDTPKAGSILPPKPPDQIVGTGGQNPIVPAVPSTNPAAESAKIDMALAAGGGNPSAGWTAAPSGGAFDRAGYDASQPKPAAQGADFNAVMTQLIQGLTNSVPAHVVTGQPAAATPAAPATTPSPTAAPVAPESDLSKLVKQSIADYLKPTDINASMATQESAIKAEQDQSLANAVQLAKSNAAQRGALDSGGITTDIVKASVNNDLITKQRVAAARTLLEQQAEQKRQFGIAQALTITQDEANKKFQSEQNDLQRVWQTGERTSSEAFQKAQLELQEAWQTGQNDAQRKFEAGITAFSAMKDKMLQDAQIAASSGNLQAELASRKQLAEADQTFRKGLQDQQIAAELKSQENTLNYNKSLNGYRDEKGNWVKGVSQLQSDYELALKLNDAEKARKIEIQIAEMQAGAQKYKVDSERYSNESNQFLEILGTAAGFLIGGPAGAKTGHLATQTLLNNSLKMGNF